MSRFDETRKRLPERSKLENRLAGQLLGGEQQMLALHPADRGYLMNPGALGSSLSAAELLADDQLILDSYLATSRG